MSNGNSKQAISIVRTVVAGVPILFACGLSACAKNFVAKSKRPEIEQILAKAEAQASEMGALWRKSMEKAGELPVGPEVCSVRDFRIPPRGALKKSLGLEGANGPDLDQVMRNAAAASAKIGASNEMVVQRGKLSEKKSPLSTRSARLIQDIRTDLEHSNKEHDELLARAKALAAQSFWTRDLTVVVDLKVDPKLDKPDASTFQSGAARGVAYVFDYQQKKIACVAEFFSENSAVVEFATPKYAAGAMGNFAISDDLEANVLESAKHALYGTGAGAP